MFILANDLLLQEASNSSSISMVGSFLSLILIFIFVLVLAFYTTKFIGSSKAKMMSKGNIKFIETVSVGGISQLHIIKVGSQYFLISSSKDGIRMLSEISGDELITQNFDKYLKNSDSDIKFSDKFSSKLNKEQKSEEKSNEE
ncbi:MAG: flagellar biosynthetic protein FliO [bacterium]